jgi:hypothetical protein
LSPQASIHHLRGSTPARLAPVTGGPDKRA